MIHSTSPGVALLATLLTAAVVTGHVGWIIAALIVVAIFTLAEVSD